jgi:hypothetical protein
MHPFFQLLITDPDKAHAKILADCTVSFWLKEALRQLASRDPVDALHDLDLLLNLYEAICDVQLQRTPTPHTRIRTLTDHTDPMTDTLAEALDQFPGEIMIGGTIDRLLIPDLLAVIAEASVSLGWETPLFAPQNEPELCRALDEKYHLHFYNGFALEGEFPALEDWLIEHLIPFTRHSTGTRAYQAERVEYRKGLTTPQRLILDQTGNELVPRDTLIRVLRALKEGQSDDATMLLEHAVGPTLTPLPPFRIAQTIRNFHHSASSPLF